MNILKRLFKKDLRKENVISDEMRLKSLETRQLNAKINALEKRYETEQRLIGIENLITGKDKTSSMEDMFMKMIMAKFLAPQQSTSSDFSYIAPQQQQGTLTEDQINQAVMLIKKKLKKDDLTFVTSISDADLIIIKNRLKE